MENLRNPWVLPEDVVILPVAELADEVRCQLEDAAEEFAITRPLARQPSQLIDTAAARLLEQFREPRTIVDAILSYSGTSGGDPVRTLEDSFPLLSQMIQSGLLLPAGTKEARGIEAGFAIGDAAGCYRILRCVQTFDDTEVYQARQASHTVVALKLARTECAITVISRFDREAAVLRRLNGIVSARLIDHGLIDGRPFLATEWISGVDVITGSGDLRDANDREALLKQIVEIARAYAALHGRGVLHGDVHPGNVLIGRNGTVTLIDFGHAQIEGQSAHRHDRGGIGFFIEPEYARTILNRRMAPAVSARGEQFAVAALLYMAVTGQHYMDFRLQQKELFRQIRNAKPLPFVQRGLEPWPELKAVLARALSVAPAKRFASMASFADGLANLTPPIAAPAIRPAHSGSESLKSTLKHVALEGRLYRDGLGEGPLSSVNFGASGIAYGLYRIACQRDDPRLLAAADAWIAKARSEADATRAFQNPAIDLTEDTIGRVSLYHARPGVHLVQAVIADARGEYAARDASVRAFLASNSQPSPLCDLTLGRGGTVLGCAMLLETLPHADPLWNEVRSAGEERLSDLWTETARFEPIGYGKQWPNVGIAHGWAGLLYLTLRWHQTVGKVIPSAFRDRLLQLMDAASPNGRGLTWSWANDDDAAGTMPGWCNGSAGIAHVFCLAHSLVGGDKFVEVAEGAGWHVWEAGEGPADLCCGYAGQAYALLELYRATSDENWLRRARVLAQRAVEIAPQWRDASHPIHSLYRGELGVAVLLSDLDEPRKAAMPLFASERWRDDTTPG